MYWLTQLGMECSRKLRGDSGLPSLKYDVPSVNWELYGAVCFSHRSAVLKALGNPLQPAAIKRMALRQNPKARISANNVRDVIRLFEQRGVVRKVWVKGRSHPRYELTDTGKALRLLLLRAEEPVFAHDTGQ